MAGPPTSSSGRDRGRRDRLGAGRGVLAVRDPANDRAVLVVEDLEGGRLDPAVPESHRGQRPEPGAGEGIAGKGLQHGAVLGADLDGERLAKHDLAREHATTLHAHARATRPGASSF